MNGEMFLMARCSVKDNYVYIVTFIDKIDIKDI